MCYPDWIKCGFCFLTSYWEYLYYFGFLLHNFPSGFDIFGIALTCKFPISGAAEVEEQDDMYILVAPQNAVGNCIIDVSG